MIFQYKIYRKNENLKIFRNNIGDAGEDLEKNNWNDS